MALLKFFDSSCSYSKTKEFVVSHRGIPIGEIKYIRAHNLYVFHPDTYEGRVADLVEMTKEIENFLEGLNKNLKS